jgi:hypothetical protein
MAQVYLCKIDESLMRKIRQCYSLCEIVRQMMCNSAPSSLVPVLRRIENISLNISTPPSSLHSSSFYSIVRGFAYGSWQESGRMKLIPTTAKSFGHLFFSYSMVRREEVHKYKYTIKILLGFVASFPT